VIVSAKTVKRKKRPQPRNVIVVAFAEPPAKFGFVQNGKVWTRVTSLPRAKALAHELQRSGIHGTIKSLGKKRQLRGKEARELAELDAGIRSLLRHQALQERRRRQREEAIRTAELLIAQKAARIAAAKPDIKRPKPIRLTPTQRLALERVRLRKGEDAAVAAWLESRAPTQGDA
jgi:hypothetical protein